MFNDEFNRRSFLGRVGGMSTVSGLAANRASGSEATGPAQGSQSAEFRIGNDTIALVLDDTGHLVTLANRLTGHSYVDAGKHAPWQMYYRSGDPMTGALDLEIDSDMQSGTVRQEENSLVVSYPSLTGHVAREGQTRELRVSLVLKVTLDGDHLVWTATIDNQETSKAIEITEIWVPWIRGIGHLGLGHTADALYWPDRAGRRIPNPYAKLSSAGRPRPLLGRRGEDTALMMTYPYPASMQWFTFNNGAEGLYFGSHDKTLMTTCLYVNTGEGETLSASIVKYPFVQAGERWSSEPSVTQVYRGGWHEAAHTYRAWTDGWIPKPNPPDWVRRTTGWLIPPGKGQTGHIRSVYADIPGIWRQARKAGINVVNYFGWVKQGFDNLYPEYEPDEAMGGADGLKAALAQIERDGGRTILYTQGQLIDPSTSFYRAKGKSIVARDVWGYEYLEAYGGRGEGTLLDVMQNKYFGVACPMADGWYERLISQFEMAKGFGAQGILFDQMGGRPPYICYSTEHPHTKPSLAAAPGKVRNMQRIHEVMRARDPNFVFVVELATDCYSGLVDVIHSHGIGFWPEPEAFGELLRYTFPEPVITNRGGGPHDRRAQLGYAFTLGWRIDAALRDVTDPVLAPYLTRINELRNAHPELLLEGRFVDTENFLCDNSEVASHAFVSGNDLAVTVWNPTAIPQSIRIAAPGYALRSAEWQDPTWSGADHLLLPGDIAVHIFQRA